MQAQNSYRYDELIACANGQLFGEGNAQLPLPPLLMFDRITQISNQGGANNKGVVTAEFDIQPDLWFFASHFKGDPIMPGCLGLDALWQLLGFYLGWSGGLGRGRALGCQDLKFINAVPPNAKLITYTVDIKRVVNRKLVLGIADGIMAVDGEATYTAKNLKVGLFQSN